MIKIADFWYFGERERWSRLPLLWLFPMMPAASWGLPGEPWSRSAWSYQFPNTEGFSGKQSTLKAGLGHTSLKWVPKAFSRRGRQAAETWRSGGSISIVHPKDLCWKMSGEWYSGKCRVMALAPGQWRWAAMKEPVLEKCWNSMPSHQRESQGFRGHFTGYQNKVPLPPS